VSHKFEQGGNAIQAGTFRGRRRCCRCSQSPQEPVLLRGRPGAGSDRKQRLGLDAEIERGVDLFRLEGAVGTDAGKNARGFWLGMDAALNARNRWKPPRRMAPAGS